MVSRPPKWFLSLLVGLLVLMIWFPIEFNYLRVYWHGDQEFFIYDLENDTATSVTRFVINQPSISGSTFFTINGSKYFGFVEGPRSATNWDFAFLYALLDSPSNFRTLTLKLSPNSLTYPAIHGLTVEYINSVPIFTTLVPESMDEPSFCIKFALNGTIFKNQKICEGYSDPKDIVSLNNGSYFLLVSDHEIIIVTAQGTLLNSIYLDKSIISFAVLDLSTSNPEFLTLSWPSNSIERLNNTEIVKSYSMPFQPTQIDAINSTHALVLGYYESPAQIELLRALIIGLPSMVATIVAEIILTKYYQRKVKLGQS